MGVSPEPTIQNNRTAAPACAATTRCSRSPPEVARCSWRACARAARTRSATPATSCARRSARSAPPVPRVSRRSVPTRASRPPRSPGGGRLIKGSPEHHRARPPIAPEAHRGDPRGGPGADQLLDRGRCRAVGQRRAGDVHPLLARARARSIADPRGLAHACPDQPAGPRSEATSACTRPVRAGHRRALRLR